MKKYTNRTAIILYLNLLIGLIHGFHEFELINFVPDSYYFIIPISFLSTFALWNGLLVVDKNKWFKFQSILVDTLASVTDPVTILRHMKMQESQNILITRNSSKKILNLLAICVPVDYIGWKLQKTCLKSAVFSSTDLFLKGLSSPALVGVPFWIAIASLDWEST